MNLFIYTYIYIYTHIQTYLKYLLQRFVLLLLHIDMLPGIVGLGVDTMSIDYGQSRTIPAHRMFTSHNLFGLENVKNVCLLPPAGATIYAFPTKIEGASGAHVRVIGSWDISAADIMLSSRVLLTCGLILYKLGL